MTNHFLHKNDNYQFNVQKEVQRNVFSTKTFCPLNNHGNFISQFLAQFTVTFLTRKNSLQPITQDWLEECKTLGGTERYIIGGCKVEEPLGVRRVKEADSGVEDRLTPFITSRHTFCSIVI